MADRQKSNMRMPEKWINVDESFAKKYPSLYQTITQMPEFIEHNKKAEAGRLVVFRPLRIRSATTTE